MRVVHVERGDFTLYQVDLAIASFGELELYFRRDHASSVKPKLALPNYIHMPPSKNAGNDPPACEATVGYQRRLISTSAAATRNQEANSTFRVDDAALFFSSSSPYGCPPEDSQNS